MLKEPLSPAAKKALDQANLHLLSADGDLANVFSAGRTNKRGSNEVSDESRLLLSEVSVELQHALSEIVRAAQAMDPDTLEALELKAITEPGFQAVPDRVTTEFDWDELKALAAHCEALRQIHQRMSGQFPDPKEESALSAAQRFGSNQELVIFGFMIVGLLFLYFGVWSPKA